MKDMVDSLSDFIESKIRDRQLRWIIGIPSFLASTAFALGLAKDVGGVANTSLVILGSFLVLSVIVLALSRSYMRKEISNRERFINRYAEREWDRQQQDPDYFRILSWEETVDVRTHGDVTITRDFKVVAGNRPIPTICTVASRNSDSHLGERVRKSISVEARFINEDDSEGPEVLSIPRLDGSKLRIFIHFDRDLSPGEEVQLRLGIRWPKYNADLLDELPEINNWTFRHAADHFKSEVTFRRSFAPKGLRLSRLPGTKALASYKNPSSKATTVTLELDALTVGKEYGYRIDLIR